MSYKKLKEMASYRDLTSTGKKVDIIKRLREYDEKLTKKLGEIFVHVRTLSGSWYDIKINKHSMGLQLKEELSKKTGIPIIKMRLYQKINETFQEGEEEYYNTRNELIDEDKTLVDQGMNFDSFCNLEIKLM